MRLRLFLLVLVLVTATNEAFAGNAPHAGRTSACVPAIAEFVQVTITRLDAGEQFFEALRLQPDGMAQWASWSSSGRLLGRSERQYPDRRMYDKLVSSPAFSPRKKEAHDYDLRRRASRIEVAKVSGGGGKLAAMSKVPSDIAAAMEKLKSRAEELPVPAGWYVWTKPYPLTEVTDLDLSRGECRSAIARALKDAAETGRLIVRADDGIRAFLSGEHASRIEFAAKMAGVELRFGVLRQ